MIRLGHTTDIFTEPERVDPDTLANLGPLRPLAGSWQAMRGLDVSPKAAGPEQRAFIETIDLQPIDPQTNGPQLFYGLRYHIHITTAEEDITFHDQVGYWLWEPQTGLVLQTIALPRGLVALAAGNATPDAREIVLTASRNAPTSGISATTFLETSFTTEGYRIAINIHDADSWSYVIDTQLRVAGQEKTFDHKDRNTLRRTAAPRPNPWAAILAARKSG